MAAESPWSRRSREVIEAALAGLPPDATDDDKRKAVSAAYPFGPRKHHPYKMWCAEVRAILGPKRPAPAIQMIHVLLGPHGVLCDWCKGEGCLGCAERRRVHASMPGLGELRAILAASLATARGPSVARNALADWYEERGLEVESRWVREEWDIAKAKRLLKVR